MFGYSQNQTLLFKLMLSKIFILKYYNFVILESKRDSCSLEHVQNNDFGHLTASMLVAIFAIILLLKKITNCFVFLFKKLSKEFKTTCHQSVKISKKIKKNQEIVN